MSSFFWMPICPLFLSFCTIVVSGQCFGNQQSLLLQLKNNLIFDSALSAKLVHWNQSADCCSWEGVTCEEGRVIGLDLTNESISGGLEYSSSLFSLQHLQNLSLGYNNFNKSQIPSELDKLMNLRFLNLSNAGFAGQIPIAISHLRSLVSLDLSTSYFVKTPLKLENPNLNTLVQNLSELIELLLDGVNISAQGNEWCRALSSSLLNLRVLSLSNSYLSGPIDSTLLKLQSLSIIRLDNNNLFTPIPEFFANFTKLMSLRLSFCGLIGTFPRKIFQDHLLAISWGKNFHRRQAHRNKDGGIGCILEILFVLLKFQTMLLDHVYLVSIPLVLDQDFLVNAFGSVDD
ncbi:receptor-like protein 6 [Corylus avellana]|uniref:receptor-like protein 6 n=1 Tax=Corylus avellana TaxID=13451 RepID=UPI00286CEB55|nr:receptor-like protein 6 [Corylus avellana]